MRFLATLTVSLFCSSYWICNLFFENGSYEWWQLRMFFYTLIISLCFYIGYKLTSGFAKSVFFVGVVFCIGDVADRYYFNINTFHVNDFLLYLFAIYYLTKPLYAGKTETDT